VVTNHTLLALHAASDHPVLPDFDVLVVDEAHELADRITSALTAKLSTAAVERAVRAAGGAGIAADALAEAAVGLGPHLDHLTEGRIAGGLPPALAAAILAAREGARAAWRAAGEAEGETDGDRQFARAQLEELVEVCNSIGGAGTGDVLWAAPVSDDAPTLALNIAPLSVAEMIPTAVFAGATAILTSATLSLGDDFAAAAGAAGLDPADRDNVWRGLDVGSPFDYASQGIVYVAASLPPPDRDGTPPEQMDTLARLIDAAGGGTLGLFTSRAAATRAAEEMRRRLDVPILAQGDEALAAMVERFREELDTCLFGTISLWQGVDVPGPACRLVTIDRIAFPRPDDPICSARADAADQAGGSGFMTVSVAHAALMLAQGAGRLIRRSTDRGVVAILDPRLVTKRYGSALRRALPPLWPTTDLDLTCQALTRLRG
jgi:ATP-dependent DNA helicase DinG